MQEAQSHYPEGGDGGGVGGSSDGERPGLGTHGAQPPMCRGWQLGVTYASRDGPALGAFRDVRAASESFDTGTADRIRPDSAVLTLQWTMMDYMDHDGLYGP